MRPPCSRTMPWLIESPSPVPSPSGLVVKNGSNTCAASASDMPGPSSATSTATPSSQRRARTTTRAGPAGAGDRLGRVVDEIDEDLLDLVGVDVGHRQVGLDLEAGLHPVRHEIVPEQQEGGVEQRLQRGGAPLVLLLPREAQQVLHDVRRPLGLLLDDGERLAQRRRDVGHLGEVVGEPDHRGERVVEVVGDAGDELADGGHLLRLDQLVLQPAALGLVVEEEDDGGPVGAANRHRGNRIGPLPGAKLDLAARSLLIQRPSGARWPTRVGRTPARAGRSGWRAGRSPGRRRPGWPAGSGRRDPRCRSPVRWRPPPPARTAGRRRGDPPGGRSRARCWPGSPGPRAGRGPRES